MLPFIQSMNIHSITNKIDMLPISISRLIHEASPDI